MAEISDIWGLQYALENKAHIDHEHRIQSVAGLKEGLKAKADAEHDHAVATADQPGFMSVADKEKLDSLGGGSGGTTSQPARTIAQITGLQTALDGKAAAGHNHTIDALTGLQTALDGKAAAGHNHTIDALTGLQAALDGKAAAGHNHTIDALTGLQAALDGKAAAGHNHTIDALTGLQAALDGKAAAGHNHTSATPSAAGFMSAADKTKLDGLTSGGGASTLAQISGLQAALDGKAAIDHTHPGLPSSGASPVPLSYTVSQSSTYQTTPLGTYANLTDGAFNTGAGTSNDPIAWIKADLGSVKAISEIWLGGGNLPGWGAIAPYLNVATLEVSKDNTSWAIAILSLAQITDTTITKFAFGGLAARYVRVRRNSNYLGVGEFRILG